MLTQALSESLRSALSCVCYLCPYSVQTLRSATLINTAAPIQDTITDLASYRRLVNSLTDVDYTGSDVGLKRCCWGATRASNEMVITWSSPLMASYSVDYTSHKQINCHCNWVSVFPWKNSGRTKEKVSLFLDLGKKEEKCLVFPRATHFSFVFPPFFHGKMKS